MNRSESLKELTAALVKAQIAMKGAKKDSKAAISNTREYNYSDFASVLDACREPLTSNGLAISQGAKGTLDMVEVETMLMHVSGEWISETLSIPVLKRDAQGYGSALTYARRYGLQALIGLASVDDDGAGAGSDTGEKKTLTASTGAKERMAKFSPQEIPEVERLAGRVLDAFADNDEQLAFSSYMDGKSILRTASEDAKAVFWSKFSSTQRSTLSKMLEAERQKQQREEPTALGMQP